MIIPSLHARFHEAMAIAGAWPHYEAFKRGLAERVRGASGRFAARWGARPLERWDFSLFSGRTEAGVPPDGGNPMKWWHDSAHFTTDFGSGIMNEIQEGRASDEQPPGGRLVPKTVAIDAHLASLRAGLAVFRDSQPAVVADVRAALGIVMPPPLSP